MVELCVAIIAVSLPIYYPLFKQAFRNNPSQALIPERRHRPLRSGATASERRALKIHARRYSANAAEIFIPMNTVQGGRRGKVERDANRNSIIVQHEFATYHQDNDPTQTTGNSTWVGVVSPRLQPTEGPSGSIPELRLD